MKRPLTHSFPMKVFAFLLSVVCFVTGFCSTGVIAAMTTFRGYGADRVEVVTDKLLEDYYARYFHLILERYRAGGEPEATEYADRVGIYYTVEDAAGDTLATNFLGQKYRVKIQQLIARDTQISVNDSSQAEEDPLSDLPLREEGENDPGVSSFPGDGTESGEEKTVTARLYVTIYGVGTPRTPNWQEGMRLVEIGWELRYTALAALFISFVLLVILLIYLFSAAGRRKDRDEPVCNFADRIPLELYTAFYVGLAVAAAAAAVGLYRALGQLDLLLWLAILVVGATLTFIFAVFYFLSIATRIKTGRFWKNTVVYWLFSLLKKLFARMKRLYFRADLVPRVAAVTALISLGDLVAAVVVSILTRMPLWAIFMGLQLILTVPYFIWIAASVERV
ncbi:MAG: hypothetical protein II776_06510, partial [Clostridia bacterium]|nr:hypothetical protein [Clostridia bacterium]